MKKLIYLTITLLISTILISCFENKTITTQLQEAEQLMEQAPDSSLVILQQIESPEKLTEKQYALWCLLITQANDKNYIVHTSDSLIRIAVNYFEKKKDKYHLMKAYYYTAAVYHDFGNSLLAQEYYLKALDLGEELEDYALLGRIYGNLGTIYIYQSLFEDAITFQKKSLKHFTITNDTTNIGMALRNLGRIYVKNSHLDSGLVYYSKTIPFITKQNCSAIYNEISDLYGRLDQHPEALKYAYLALNSLINKNDILSVYCNLGDIYRQTEQYDSAYYYLIPCLNTPNIYAKSGVNLSLSFLEKERKNWEASYQYLSQYLYLRDSINKMERTENLQRIQSLYDYQQVEKEKDYFEQEANKRMINNYQLMILCLLFLILSTVLFFYHKKNKQKERERHEKEMRLLEQKTHAREQININEKEEKLSKFKTGLLYQTFLTEDIRISDNDWATLKTEFENIYPDFTYHLKMQLPTIKEEEIRLCYLIKIDIPVKQVANLLNLTSQAISLKRKRLYEKLTGIKGSANSLDELLSLM